jgi:hypothetical protein
MEVPGHMFLLFLAIVAMYGLLANKRGHRRWRFTVAVPAVTAAGALWFGVGGVLTSVVGFSFGAQLFLGARLYLFWQRNDKNPH